MCSEKETKYCLLRTPFSRFLEAGCASPPRSGLGEEEEVEGGLRLIFELIRLSRTGVSSSENSSPEVWPLSLSL